MLQLARAKEPARVASLSRSNMANRSSMGIAITVELGVIGSVTAACGSRQE